MKNLSNNDEFLCVNHVTTFDRRSSDFLPVTYIEFSYLFLYPFSIELLLNNFFVRTGGFPMKRRNAANSSSQRGDEHRGGQGQ